MYSLFSILSLSGFRKLDYAQPVSHLRKVILNLVIWNSGCGASSKQARFRPSLIWRLEREKLGAEVITRPWCFWWEDGNVKGVWAIEKWSHAFIYADIWDNGSNAQWQLEYGPGKRNIAGQAFRGAEGPPYSPVGCPCGSWWTLCDSQ